MDGFIVERTVGGEDDKRIVLRNDNIVGGVYQRKIAVGSAWTNIRIVFRLSTTRMTNWTSAPVFYAGMCASSRPSFDGTMGHFIGMNTSGNWVDLSPPTQNLFLTPVSRGFITNGTRTDLGGWGGRIASTIDGWGCVCLELNKASSTTINIRLASLLSGSANQAMVKNVLEAPNYNSILYDAWGVATATVNEAINGYLDSIVFYWNGITEDIEISDVDYRVIS